jgi:outer membrane protein TolC
MIKIKVIYATALLMTGICGATLAQEQVKELQVLTLTDCFDYAFRNSYNLRKSALDVLETDAAHSETKAALLPQLSGTASLTDNIRLATMLMPGDMFGADEDIAVELGAKWNSAAGISLEQVVFDAALFNGLKISRNARELARLKAQMTREELIYNIGMAYCDIIYSQNLLETNNLTLSIMDSIYKKTELQVAQKVTREIDLNRMKVNISNMKVDIQKTLATLTQQKNYLKILMGMPVDADFKVETPRENTPGDGADAIGVYQKQIDLRGQKTVDLHEKTDLKALDREKTAAALEISQIKKSYLPTLTFAASSGYNFESPKFNPGDKKFWSNGTFLKLTLAVPIFDGGQKHHQIKQAQFRLQKAQEEMRQTEQNILSECENYRSQLLAEFNAVNAQRENTDVAEKTYRQGVMLYEEGLYSITELLDTEKEYREAQTAYTYELVNYHKTLLDLMKAEGNLESLVNNNNHKKTGKHDEKNY